MQKPLVIAVGLIFTSMVAADVTVTGTAQIPYAPDCGIFSINVSGEGDTVAVALQKRNAATKSLREALTATGLMPGDLKVSQSIGQRRGSYGSLSGVKATNHLTIVVMDLTKMAPLLDVLVVRREGVQMTLELSNSQMDKLMDKAREAAVTDARRKADLYARSSGATLGPVVSITEVSVSTAEQQATRQVDTVQQTAAVELRVVFSLNGNAK